MDKTLQIIQLACLSITAVGLLVAIFFLRRASKYNEIARKIRAGEQLTGRERRLADRIS